MKKLMTLALTALVVAAQAANINWTIGGNTTYVVYEKDGSTPVSSAYLVLASDLSSLAAYDEGTSPSGNKTQAEFETALAALTLDSASTANGTKPNVSKKLVSSDKLTASQSTPFALLTYCVDSDGNGWYKVATVNATPWADGTDVKDQKTVTTPWAQLGSASYVSAWTKPTEPITPDIPEPATGALALAGVALLFKRRRA